MASPETRATTPEADGKAAAGWQKSALRENFESVAVAALFAIFVRGFIAQPYKIPSGSMEETLLIGDHLVVNKVVYGGGATSKAGGLLPAAPVRRGDVIIFRPPPTPNSDEGTDYIKRVIGLPGEELALIYDRTRGGVRVEVNGRRLPENYQTAVAGPVTQEPGARWTVNFTGDPTEARHGWERREVRLADDEFWVMGDNRNDSMDSRFWGAVKGHRIRGRAWMLYWSHDNEWMDGRGKTEPQTLAERFQFYGHVAFTLISRTRFERMFSLIH